jgi:hypothetical protein
VYHNRLLFGRDPTTLTAIEGCAGKQHLVDVDLASGRATPRLKLPSQLPLLFADFDAARAQLLLDQPPGRRPEDPTSLVVWDGGRSLRHVLDLKDVEVDGVTYRFGGAQW